jgi:hypothetical protein
MLHRYMLDLPIYPDPKEQAKGRRSNGRRSRGEQE